MEKLERKAASVTSRSYWIWIEIFHQNLFLLRSAVLVSLVKWTEIFSVHDYFHWGNKKERCDSLDL